MTVTPYLSITYVQVTTMHRGLQAVAYGVPERHCFHDGDDAKAWRHCLRLGKGAPLGRVTALAGLRLTSPAGIS
jgi:hypothetical protein